MGELPGAVAMTLGGEHLLLLPDRAVYWPSRERLLIADLHLGKGDTFRLAGISVPTGGTRHDLERLGALIAQTGARECWVLGDLVHGQVEQGEWIAQANAFIAAHTTTRFAVIAGNHDRALAKSGLHIAPLGECVNESGIDLLHVPPADTTHPSISGHLHPVLRLPGEIRASALFWQRGERLVLPAFSAFTGGWRVAPARGDRLHVCGPRQLLRVEV